MQLLRIHLGMYTSLFRFSPVLFTLLGDIRKTFIIITALLPLSSNSQGGNMFSWLGTPLMFVLTDVKMRMEDMGQPLQMLL